MVMRASSCGRESLLFKRPPKYSPAVVCTAMNRSEEHTSELQSLMRISYAVFCLKKQKPTHVRLECRFINYNTAYLVILLVNSHSNNKPLINFTPPYRYYTP